VVRLLLIQPASNATGFVRAYVAGQVAPSTRITHHGRVTVTYEHETRDALVMFEINGDGRAVNPLVAGWASASSIAASFIADKDICHGNAPDPQDPHASLMLHKMR
jgi:hypothetical protein